MAKLMLWLLSILAIFSAVSSIDDKCGACNAVAEELELGLSNEKPRNHLDMRHRLDSKGQRRGKVIDYRVSELRVVDLLDGLCEKMQEYTLEQIDSTRREWVKVDDWDNLTIDRQEARAYSKDISSYCGRLLEETEDELAELIKEGSVKAGGVSKVLCQDLSKHCSQTRQMLIMMMKIVYQTNSDAPNALFLLPERVAVNLVEHEQNFHDLRDGNLAEKWLMQVAKNFLPTNFVTNYLDQVKI